MDVSQQRQGGQGPSKVGGEFSWTREEGKTVNLIFAQHPMSDSYIAALPDFEKKTAIKVQYDALPEEEFRQKLLTDLSTGKGNYDAFMTGPVTNWQYAAAGWIAPLDGYIDKSRDCSSVTTTFKTALSGSGTNGSDRQRNRGR